MARRHPRDGDRPAGNHPRGHPRPGRTEPADAGRAYRPGKRAAGCADPALRKGARRAAGSGRAQARDAQRRAGTAGRAAGSAAETQRGGRPRREAGGIGGTAGAHQRRSHAQEGRTGAAGGDRRAARGDRLGPGRIRSGRAEEVHRVADRVRGRLHGVCGELLRGIALQPPQADRGDSGPADQNGQRNPRLAGTEPRGLPDRHGRHPRGDAAGLAGDAGRHAREHADLLGRGGADHRPGRRGHHRVSQGKFGGLQGGWEAAGRSLCGRMDEKAGRPEKRLQEGFR